MLAKALALPTFAGVALQKHWFTDVVVDMPSELGMNRTYGDKL